MKKQLLIILIIIVNAICFLASFAYYHIAKAEQSPKYAQVQKEGVFFYSLNGEELFVIPKTFYVELLDKKNEQGFYSARYINQKGLVKANEIQCVSLAPNQPFLNYVNFRILANQSAEIRTEPSKKGGANTLICSLDLYETNFIFYGKMQGDEVVPLLDNIWFYCEYVKANQHIKGYVYSGLVDQVAPYTELELSSCPIDEHNWEEDVQANASPSTSLALDMPNNTQMIIIICISIPILLLLLALFAPVKIGKIIKTKPIKNNKSATNKDKINVIDLSTVRKKISKAEKGKDYYELK